MALECIFFSLSLIADPVKIDKNRVAQTETVAYAEFSKGGQELWK